MKIVPFKAVRPANDKVGLVTCRVYDDYSPAELAAWLEFNPFSFLHIIHPAYVNAQKVANEKRFKMVNHKYNDFKTENILVQEEKAVFYIYEIETKENIFSGIIAGASVEEYQNNIIKKHEDTLRYRVELFTDYLHQTGFNTEPVLLTYPDCVELSTWMNLRKKTEPIFQFSTPDKTKHTLWKIDTFNEIEWLQNHFETIPNLYIADGHHRSASAALLYEQYKYLGNENLPYFMSFLIAESNLKIYEFHRMITDLNTLTDDDFLDKLTINFELINKGHEWYKPQKKGEFGLYFKQNFYQLVFKNSSNLQNSVLDLLDAKILYDYVLKPILGIEDLRDDDRIEYVSGKQPLTNVVELVDNEDFALAFLLYPSNITEIKQIADDQLIMPPKSTYIEPKFRSGLVVYEL